MLNLKEVFMLIRKFQILNEMLLAINNKKPSRYQSKNKRDKGFYLNHEIDLGITLGSDLLEIHWDSKSNHFNLKLKVDCSIGEINRDVVNLWNAEFIHYIRNEYQTKYITFINKYNKCLFRFKSSVNQHRFKKIIVNGELLKYPYLKSEYEFHIKVLHKLKFKEYIIENDFILVKM